MSIYCHVYSQGSILVQILLVFDITMCLLKWMEIFTLQMIALEINICAHDIVC